MEPNRDAPLLLFLGDVLRLRKPHPCGGFEWTVVRLGADIGLTCNQCGRRVLLPRREVQRRMRLFVSRGAGYAAAQRLVAEQDAVDGDGVGPADGSGAGDSGVVSRELTVPESNGV